jgi:metal-responsive CopG/Arc/MetJ family transcriptional regulator
MAQVVTRLDDKLIADLDGLVADGFVASRSEGVRVALEKLVDEQRRRRIGAEIVAGTNVSRRPTKSLPDSMPRHAL